MMRRRMGIASRTIEAMGEGSQKISGIAKVIKEIAANVETIARMADRNSSAAKESA